MAVTRPLGYNITAKRAIETESGVNIDNAIESLRTKVDGLTLEVTAGDISIRWTDLMNAVEDGKRVVCIEMDSDTRYYPALSKFDIGGTGYSEESGIDFTRVDMESGKMVKWHCAPAMPTVVYSRVVWTRTEEPIQAESLFIAEYDVTPYTEIDEAFNSGKTVLAKFTDGYFTHYCHLVSHLHNDAHPETDRYDFTCSDIYGDVYTLVCWGPNGEITVDWNKGEINTRKRLDALYYGGEVFLSPENGDDSADGMTAGTAVKTLNKAIKIYSSNHRGCKKVQVRVIETHGPEHTWEEDHTITPNPGNCTNLLVTSTDTSGIEEVVLHGDGGICISNTDYSGEPYVTYAPPNYSISMDFAEGIGIYLNGYNPSEGVYEYFDNYGVTAASHDGDVYITGSYKEHCTHFRLTAEKGRVVFSPGPAFNTFSGVTTEFDFVGRFVCVWAPPCGKRLHVKQTYDGPSIDSSYFIGSWWIKGDVLIESAGDIGVRNGSCYSSGKVTIRSLSCTDALTGSSDIAHPLLTLVNPLMGRGNDDSSYPSSSPSLCTYPSLAIDWSGTVLFGGGHFKNINIKAGKFSLNTSSSILSQNDITIDAYKIDMANYSTGAYIYCLGKMTFTAKTEVKVVEYLFTDHLEIRSGGTPKCDPVAYNPTMSTTPTQDGLTITADVHCKITNLFESVLGDADPVFSTDVATYSVTTTGDYCDYWSSFLNGNANVTLNVDGYAILAYNGSPIVRRMTVNCDRLMVTNSGVYSSSYDIHAGVVQQNNSGCLYQYFGYGGSWTYKDNSTWGASWNNLFADRSVFDCESLEWLNPGVRDFIKPSYPDGFRHDWDIHVGTLVPYRCDGTSTYSGGPMWCHLVGTPYQGTPNGSITGEVGDIMLGTGQFVSQFQHDILMTSSVSSYYEKYAWNGCVVSLHLSKKIWHHLYIDFDQGSDAYDGLSAETPVRTMRGLKRACDLLVMPPNFNYMTIHVLSGCSGNNRGTYSYADTPFNFDQALFSYDAGLLYNHYAVQYLNTNAATLLPEGWHVPSRAEFGSLARFDSRKLHHEENCGTNEYGFNLFPCGYFNSYSSFDANGFDAGYWTSDIEGTNTAYKCSFHREGGQSTFDSSSMENAFPVRLVKDGATEADGTRGTVEIGGDTYETVVLAGRYWICRNLDYKFAGGHYRTASNPFARVGEPMYGYWEYAENGTRGIKFGRCNYLEIVSDAPYVSTSIRGLEAGLCKISGFWDVYMIDPRVNCLEINCSNNLYYYCGYDYPCGYGQSKEYHPFILSLHAQQITACGLSCGGINFIEAINRIEFRNSSYGLGTSAPSCIQGLSYIHARDIEFYDTPVEFRGTTTIAADNYFNFSTPCNLSSCCLSIKSISATSSPASGSTCNFGVANWFGGCNVSIDSLNQPVNIFYLNFSQTSSGNGKLYVNADSIECHTQVFGCDIDFRTRGGMVMGGFTAYGYSGAGSRVNIDCGGELGGSPSFYGYTGTIRAYNLGAPVGIPGAGPNTCPTILSVIAERANGIFLFKGAVGNGMDFKLASRITMLEGPVWSLNSDPTYPATFPDDGSYITSFKNFVGFYTGSDPDTDLADFHEIAPNADYECIVLNMSKSLVAGDGIRISDTGDNVVIAAVTPVVTVPVTVSGGVATAGLSSGKYTVMDGITSSATSLVVTVPETSATGALSEMGFEFYLGKGVTLGSVTFDGDSGLVTKMPDSFTEEHLYQGTIVNHVLVMAEFDKPDASSET